MAAVQRRDGLVVGDAAPIPGDRVDPVLVGHGRPRLVADVPSGVVQAPDEIDVLAEVKILVEAGPERRTA